MRSASLNQRAALANVHRLTSMGGGFCQSVDREPSSGALPGLASRALSHGPPQLVGATLGEPSSLTLQPGSVYRALSPGAPQLVGGSLRIQPRGTPPAAEPFALSRGCAQSQGSLGSLPGASTLVPHAGPLSQAQRGPFTIWLPPGMERSSSGAAGGAVAAPSGAVTEAEPAAAHERRRPEPFAPTTVWQPRARQEEEEEGSECTTHEECMTPKARWIWPPPGATGEDAGPANAPESTPASEARGYLS